MEPDVPDAHQPGIPCHLVRRVPIEGGEILVWADGRASRYVEGEREDWCEMPPRAAWEMEQVELFGERAA